MAITAKVMFQLGCRFGVLLPHLNERQRRLTVAVEARLLGHGGVRAAAQVAGVSETTVRRGVASWRRVRIRFRTVGSARRVAAAGGPRTRSRRAARAAGDGRAG